MTNDELYESSLGLENKSNLVFVLVSVENSTLASLLNLWSLRRGSKQMNLFVHEIFHPWKEE